MRQGEIAFVSDVYFMDLLSSYAEPISRAEFSNVQTNHVVLSIESQYASTPNENLNGPVKCSRKSTATKCCVLVPR